jgi:hypothetical protein
MTMTMPQQSPILSLYVQYVNREDLNMTRLKCEFDVFGKVDTIDTRRKWDGEENREYLSLLVHYHYWANTPEAIAFKKLAMDPDTQISHPEIGMVIGVYSLKMCPHGNDLKYLLNSDKTNDNFESVL